MKLSTVVLRWDRFLFEPISPLNVSVLRIIWGILALASTLMLLPDRYMWFSRTGLWTVEQARTALGTDRLDLMSQWITSDAGLDIWFAALIIALSMVTLGLFTRVSTIVAWAMLTSVCHRNNLILHSGDTLLRLTGFFMIFAPTGHCLSLDAWWRNRRTGQSILVAPLRSPYAQRVVQIQLCIVYFITAWWKLKGPEWNQGTAVGYVLNLLEFQRFPLPDFMRDLTMSKMLTGMTGVVELLFPLLIWFKDTRTIALLAGLGLHVGLEYSMNVQLFQPIICSLYSLFLEGSTLQAAIEKIARFFRHHQVQDSPQVQLKVQ